MTISCWLKYPPAKRSISLATACFLCLGLGSFSVLASETKSESSRGLHDPLEQPSIIQDLSRPQPAVAIAQAGGNLVSVGLRGLIMISSDGGNSWSPSTSPVASDLVQVHFRDELHGWAVGHDSVLLATTDGGKSWEVRLDGRSLVTLLREYYSTAAGIDEYEAESLLGEVDLALSTSSDSDVMATPFLDVFINDNGEGFLLGAFGMLLHTIDDGMTWQPWIERTENERRMHLYSIDMHGEQAYISGEQGLVMRLDRGLGRFVRVETLYTGTFFGVHVRDGLVMAYGLRGNLYVSRNEGLSWDRVDTQQQASLVDSLEDGPNHFILVSQRGELIRLDSRNLETARLEVPFSGEVSSAVILDGSRELMVTQFSGVRKIDISKLN
ncbi:WD40/YVTN/BNR-like repeat-containing protein [Halopseudomonas bauzanensis]|uniref:Glycosyl hydrolase n=1 Tax=Halopseudomonas bauzanensis TaxID=653930 RepID=A0A4U0YH10_9GAMM|nr:YCF48-related protein [Halopseudomonas bauzanensis]TKA89709.1 glycosyl hydrolase [Halopseudomonas bauzanensis]